MICCSHYVFGHVSDHKIMIFKFKFYFQSIIQLRRTFGVDGTKIMRAYLVPHWKWLLWRRSSRNQVCVFLVANVSGSEGCPQAGGAQHLANFQLIAFLLFPSSIKSWSSPNAILQPPRWVSRRNTCNCSALLSSHPKSVKWIHYSLVLEHQCCHI